MLLKAIRALRNSERLEAQRISRGNLFRENFKRYSTILTLDEFSAAATPRSNELLSASILRKLIRMELLILNLPLIDEPSNKDVRWSTILATGQDSPMPPLSLETITEFDPHKNVFKDNVWTVGDAR